MLPSHTRRVSAWLLPLCAAALFACGDDTSVAIRVGEPIPPGQPGAPPPAGGGTVIVVTSGARERDAKTAGVSRTSAQHAAPKTRRAGRVHTDRLYLPSPGGAARIAADDHAVAADPGSGGKNYDDDTNVDFGYDGAPRHAFLRARLTDIPPRARIERATLEILARFADAEPHCSVYVGLVPKDGRWDGRWRRPRWGLAPDFDAIATARDAAGAPLATTDLSDPGAANFGIGDTGDTISLVSSTEVGPTLTVSRSGTLADLQLQLRRVGSVPGSTRVRVERCRADDGSDDRPDGIPLEVSEPIEASAISTTLAGSLMTYSFAAGPSLAQGARYAFVLESDAIGSAANHLQVKIHHGDAYAAGGLVNRGLSVAWNIVAYPALNQLPFFFEEDLVTPRTPPFGTLARIDEVPAFPAPDTWVDVADLTAQLQEWVDGPSYWTNDEVAIELFTTASTPPGAFRRGKAFRLRVTWEEPAQRIAITP